MGLQPQKHKKKNEPASLTVTAQDPTLPSRATKDPSPRPVRDRQPPCWMKYFVCSVFSHVSKFISG